MLTYEVSFLAQQPTVFSLSRNLFNIYSCLQRDCPWREWRSWDFPLQYNPNFVENLRKSTFETKDYVNRQKKADLFLLNLPHVFI